MKPLLAIFLLPLLLSCHKPLVRTEVQSAVPIAGPVRIQEPLPISLTQPVQVSVQGPSVDYQGTFISEELMNLIKEKETTAEWVLAVLGEPDHRSTLSDGSEIWRWAYRPVRHQGKLINIIGDGDDKDPKPEHITAYVRIRDGVVVEKWRG